MFGRKLAKMQQELESALDKNDELQKKLQLTRERTLAAAYHDVDECTHVFDWAAVNAFSMERQIKNENGVQVAYTIIGFIRGIIDGEVRTGEWTFICSQEEHNRLAADFTLYLAIKNQRGPKTEKAPPKDVPVKRKK